MLYQKYSEIIKKLNHFFDKKKQPVVFVHVDLFRSFRLDYNNKNDFFKQHYELIKKITNYSKLIFPCFNYNFPNTKIFNIEKSKSQTDYFTEYFRIKFAKMRTNVPIFSVTANYKLNLSNKFKTINPFGKNSIFHYLYKKNANILYYGAPFSSSTFIMYVEDTFKNGPIYRYKKLIKGKIIDKKILFGSWAGAFGNFQFMPRTIRNYAIDYNKNTTIELKKTEDSFASAANYLNKIGWKKNTPCFIKIKLNNNIPNKFLNSSARNIKNKNKVKYFKKYIENYNNLKVDLNLEAAIITPDIDIIPGANTYTPAYLVFSNYEKILNWNRSLRFALAVCTLKNNFKNEI